MIYIDVSHLNSFLQTGRPLSGIQRLTLNTLVGLERKLGPQGVRAMIYSASDKAYRCCAVATFLHDLGRTKTQLDVCSFGRDDKILLTEYFWNRAVTTAAANRTSFTGAKIYRFIHDVIPVAVPRLFTRSWVKQFRRFVSEAIANADVVLTNSDYSRGDLLKHFPQVCVGKPILVLKLPHEFLSSNDMLGQEAVKATIPDGLQDQAFALMVGSLEGRKNAQLAVRAWRKLAAEKGSAVPQLVIVGAYTSHNLFYRARLRWAIHQTPSILHLNACDDACLQWLYQNCRFSVYLSSYEGWGLPLGESLWFGKPVIASNATSLPEVGPDLVDYVDPTDERAVVAGLRRLCFEDGYCESKAWAIDREKLKSWGEFVDHFIIALK